MVKKFSFWLTLTTVVVVLAGSCWAQRYTIDDVMKEVREFKVGQAELRAEVKGINERVNSIENQLGRTNTMILSLFGTLAAAMLGIVVLVFSVYKEVKVPKEERVAKLERVTETLEESFRKFKEYLGQVGEKLHLPKPIL